MNDDTDRSLEPALDATQGRAAAHPSLPGLLLALGCPFEDVDRDPAGTVEAYACTYLDLTTPNWYVLEWEFSKTIWPYNRSEESTESLIWALANGGTMAMRFPLSIPDFHDGLGELLARGHRASALIGLMSAEHWDPNDDSTVNAFWAQFAQLLRTGDNVDAPPEKPQKLREVLGEGWQPIAGQATARDCIAHRLLLHADARVGPRPHADGPDHLKTAPPFVLGFDDNHVTLFNREVAYLIAAQPDDHDGQVNAHRATLGPLGNQSLTLEHLVGWLNGTV